MGRPNAAKELQMTENVNAGGSFDELTAMMIEQGLMPGPTTSDDMPETIEAVEAVEATTDEIDAALADLAIEAAPEAPVETLVEAESDDLQEEDIFSVVAELEAEEAKHEVYAEQESDIGEETPAIEATPARSAEPKAPKESRAAPVPRSSRLAGATHGDYVAAKLDDAAIAAAVDGLPKKVKDKAANLVDHIKAGKALSIYTQVAVDMMRRDGAITNAKLVEALQASGKKDGSGTSIGTARSQAGQMMALFGKLGLARPDGAKGLVPDADNKLWQALAA
jgi:hypothetical protein